MQERRKDRGADDSVLQPQTCLPVVDMNFMGASLVVLCRKCFYGQLGVSYPCAVFSFHYVHSADTLSHGVVKSFIQTQWI